MKRALIYLFIFTLAACLAVFSLAYLSNPYLEHGQSNNTLVTLFLVAVFIALSLAIGLIISVIKTFMPSHKLPHLLVRESLITASLISLGITGLLVLQLLRAATVVNIALWITIIIASIWILRSWQKAVKQPPANQKRLPILTKKNRAS